MLSGGLSGRHITFSGGTLRFRLGLLRRGRLGGLPRPARLLLSSTGPGLRLGLPRPARVLLSSTGPGLGLGHPGLGLGHPGLRLGRPGFRAADRGVPLLPHRSHLLPSSPFGLGGPCLRSLCFPLSGCLRRQRLSKLRISLLGTGLKPGPGRLCRRDLRFEPGPQFSLVPRSVLAGLHHLPVRSPAGPVQLRAARLGRLPRPARVLLSSTGPGLRLGHPGLGVGHPGLGLGHPGLRVGRPGLGLGRPGLRLGRPGFRAADRSVPLLPHRSHLLPSSPLGLGGPCLRSLCLPLSGCLRRQRLSKLRISLLGTGLKPGPGRLCRRDLRFEPGPQFSLVPRSVLAGLHHLPVRSPAGPVQLRAARLGRLPRPARVLLSSTGPGLRLGDPGLRLGRPGLRVGRPGLGLGHPGLRLGRPGFRAADRSVPLLPHRSHLLPSSPLGLGGPSLRSLCLPLSGCLRRQRLSKLRISLECGRMRLPRLSLSPLAAPP